MNSLLKIDNSEKLVSEVYTELEKALFNTLKTYSNVHRGTGHNSMITTALYERSREIILEYFKLDKKN
ncbi:MAG: hypothetical protein ACFE8N_10130, partial [Promethearchaeota archaeon]